MVFDAGLVTLAFIAAYFTNKHFRSFYTLDLFPAQQVIKGIGAIEAYFPLLLLFVPLWLIFMKQAGVYRPLRRRKKREIFFGIFRAGIFTIVGFSVFTFVFKIHYVSRLLIILLFGYSILFLTLEKIALLLFFRAIRRRGFNSRNILIVGTGKRADKYIEEIEKHAEWGLRIIGLVDIDKSKVGKNHNNGNLKVLGTLEDIPHLLKYKVIDEVIFVVPRSWLDRIEESILFCEAEGVRCFVAMDLFNLRIGRLKQTDFEDMPMLSIETTVGKEWQRFVKRTIDLFGSLLALIILSPVFLFAIVGIKVFCGGGPIFFRQVRLGLNGRKFLCYKFRSMVSGAHTKLKELRDKNEMQGPVFKLARDPRITAFGQLIRKLSIDELPQLYNVLRGEMSLVGPRPPIPAEVRKYETWQRRRLSMKPGITCLWQVNGRNKIKDFNQWMKLDLEYIDNWSLWLDTKILLKTIPVVLFGVGAK